jgi:glycosyltransferase involved in cell wall biosynthesis
VKSLFVIAAYNEARAIHAVVQSLIDAGQCALVVDDGSSDDTWQQLLAFKDKIYRCRHPINLGQGAALQTGIVCARMLGPEYVVTFDADGQHRIADALAMIEHMDKHPELQALLGSRFLGGTTNLPSSKLLALKAGVMFTRVFSGIKVTDAHNGLRVLRCDFFQRFSFEAPGMEHASEILDYMALKKVPFEEFPVTIDYTAYSIAKGSRWSSGVRLALRLIEEKL